LLSTLKVSQLERKLAVQQAYVKEANEKLQSAMKPATSSTVPDCAPEAASKHYKQATEVCQHSIAAIASGRW